LSKSEKKVIVDENVDLDQDLNDSVEEIVDEKDLIIKELEDKITNLLGEVENVKKAAADIVNRKKQIEIDKKYAASDLVKKILIPLSYFEGALKYKTDDEAFNNFLKGFEMIYNLLLDTLKSDGLKEINTNVNDDFDPRLHQVTEVVEVGDGTSDKILEILHQGYTYKDRVIKPVQVKVSKIKKETNDNQEIEEENNQVN